MTFDGGILPPRPRKVAMAGVARTFQNIRAFQNMTAVEDNLLLGAHTRKDAAGVRADLDRIYGLFEVLAERRSQAAGLFSGGEQQMLAIGRAIMSRPKLPMLDEPSMGLSPIMTRTIMETLVELRAAGTTILLVEQNAHAALSLADRGYVLEVGRIAFTDTGAALLKDDRIKRTYLGVDETTPR